MTYPNLVYSIYPRLLDTYLVSMPTILQLGYSSLNFFVTSHVLPKMTKIKFLKSERIKLFNSSLDTG